MSEQSTEDRLIDALLARQSGDGERVLIGPGDDAAMVRCPEGEELLITTDTLNEGVHFPAGISPHSLGHRALAASLSDLAAMAARPLWAVVTLSVPCAEESWLKEFADGLYALAKQFDIQIVGGDFVRGPLNVTVTAHGAATADAVLRRSGAAAGDGIWVSGFLGDAAAGLKLIEERHERRAPRERGLPALDEGRMPSFQVDTPSLQPAEASALMQRFCYPQPRVDLGRKLAGIASACMDLSDGLLQDLPRLLRKSELGARVAAEQLPLSSELRVVADPEKAMTLGLNGGDDYELCFTVPKRNEWRLAQAAGELLLTRIGELHEGDGLAVMLDGKPWRPEHSGFTHFS